MKVKQTKSLKKSEEDGFVCHDCGCSLKTGDEVAVYDLSEKGIFYKCADCYEQNKHLENYQKCEVYSRIVGYIRPIDQWNVGKVEEYKDRKEFEVAESYEGCRTGCC